MKFQSLFFLSSPRESCIQLSSMEHLTITDDSDDSTVCRLISVFFLLSAVYVSEGRESFIISEVIIISLLINSASRFMREESFFFHFYEIGNSMNEMCISFCIHIWESFALHSALGVSRREPKISNFPYVSDVRALGAIHSTLFAYNIMHSWLWKKKGGSWSL